ELLASERLVTLTGPGGVGKTRLGVQAAGRAAPLFSDGAWLVELAGLRDPELVAGAVASALGIKERPSTPTLDAIKRHLACARMLLVLDNCEHVVAAAAQLCRSL